MRRNVSGACGPKLLCSNNFSVGVSEHELQFNPRRIAAIVGQLADDLDETTDIRSLPVSLFYGEIRKRTCKCAARPTPKTDKRQCASC